MSVIIDSDNNNVNITEEPINVTVSLGGPDVAAVWGGITGDITEQEDLQAALDDKVPYTGATGNVDLGEYELKAGQIELDTTPTGTAGVAVTRWNDTVGTIETTLKGGNVVLKHGRDMFERVVNKTGIQLTRAAYQAVRISTAQGQRLGVALARANNDMNSADTIGLAVETIDNNQEGIIYTVGEIDNINTTGSLQGETWADGDVLYLSPDVSGRITNVKPVAPEHLVVIGYVVYAHANNGKIYVKVMNGWELGELHDVDTTGATNGQVLTYNGSIWTPATNGSGTITSIATSAPITGGTITTTGTIGITQAGAAADGYLSSVDWSTFNNKQSALSLTTTGTSGAATLVGSTLNIPQYQAALTNPVTGTGTAGQVAYWSGTSLVTGSSSFLWNGTTLSVGGTTVFTPKVYINGLLEIVDGQGITNGASLTNGEGIRFSSAFGLNLFTTGQNALRIFNTTRNIAIQNGGTFTDNGQRLQVYGSTLLRGSGTTSATTALLVQNSTPSALLTLTDDGVFKFGSSNAPTQIFPFSAAFNTPLVDQRNLQLFSSVTTQAATLGAFYFTGLDFTQTANNQIFVNIGKGFAPTSGTATFANIVSSPTVNQTGGANGITRGLYVSPILTAAADWRSIETSNNTGYAIYTAGTANSYFGGNVGIGTTTPGASFETTLGMRMSGSGQQSFEFSNATRAQFRAIFGGFSFRSSTGLFISNADGDPTARLHVRGSGTTSATTALLVQNSTPSELLTVRDSGEIVLHRNIRIGNAGTGAPNILPFTTTQSSTNTTGTNLSFYSNTITESAINGTFTFTGEALASTSSNQIHLLSIRSFAPTSGTAVHNNFEIRPTINQTGGANGITRGLYVNPTLTAAADWRGIESVAASNANHTLLKLRNATVDVFTVKADSKIGFFNATPVAQPTTGIAEAAFVENSGGTAVNVDSTFAGYTIQQIAQALKDLGILA